MCVYDLKDMPDGKFQTLLWQDGTTNFFCIFKCQIILYSITGEILKKIPAPSDHKSFFSFKNFLIGYEAGFGIRADINEEQPTFETFYKCKWFYLNQQLPKLFFKLSHRCFCFVFKRTCEIFKDFNQQTLYLQQFNNCGAEFLQISDACRLGLEVLGIVFDSKVLVCWSIKSKKIISRFEDKKTFDVVPLTNKLCGICEADHSGFGIFTKILLLQKLI